MNLSSFHLSTFVIIGILSCYHCVDVASIKKYHFQAIDYASDQVILDGPRLSDEEILSLCEECRAEFPRYIFYNRVPKCGSTTIQQYIRTSMITSKHTNSSFKWLSYIPSTVRNHPDNEPYTLRPSGAELHFRLKEIASETRAVIDAHTTYYRYFSDSSHIDDFGYGQLAYFNIFRDPLSRMKSFFHYQCAVHNLNCDLGFLEFVKVHGTNTMVKYVCGFQKDCYSESEDALYIAKVRLALSYSLVGITEDLLGTTKQLRMKFPTFFQQDYDGKKHNTRLSKFKERRVTASEEVEFLNNNRLDSELYNFAKRIFQTRNEACKALMN